MREKSLLSERILSNDELWLSEELVRRKSIVSISFLSSFVEFSRVGSSGVNRVDFRRLVERKTDRMSSERDESRLRRPGQSLPTRKSSVDLRAERRNFNFEILRRKCRNRKFFGFRRFSVRKSRHVIEMSSSFELFVVRRSLLVEKNQSLPRKSFRFPSRLGRIFHHGRELEKESFSSRDTDAARLSVDFRRGARGAAKSFSRNDRRDEFFFRFETNQETKQTFLLFFLAKRKYAEFYFKTESKHRNKKISFLCRTKIEKIKSVVRQWVLTIRIDRVARSSSPNWKLKLNRNERIFDEWILLWKKYFQVSSWEIRRHLARRANFFVCRKIRRAKTVERRTKTKPSVWWSIGRNSLSYGSLARCFSRLLTNTKR